MSQLFKKPYKIIKIISKLWPVVWILFIGSEALLYYQYSFRIKDSILPYIILLYILIFIICFICYRRKFVTNNVNYIGYIISAIISLYYGYGIVSKLNMNDFFDSKIRLCMLAGNMYFIFIVSALVVSLLSKYCFLQLDENTLKKDIDTIKKQFFDSFIFASSFCVVYYLYLPAETFFSSFQDYSYPYWLLIKAISVDAIFCLFILTVLGGTFLNNKMYALVRAIEMGILVGIYGQYMFMNGSIGLLDGSAYDIGKHIHAVVINTLFWITIIVVPLVIALKKRTLLIRISRYIIVMIGLIHLISYISIVVTADKKCFEYASVYYDFSEQFTLGNKENIVVLIIDAADNRMYMDKLLSSDDTILEDFKDFNIYTNTCSVYDYTNHSQLQMITNFPFDNTCGATKRREIAWNTPWANEFYNRLHDAGYKVNFYNLDNESSENVLGKIDNAKSANSNDIGIQYINYKVIKGKNSEITRFRILPDILKNTVKFDNINKSLEHTIVYSNGKGCYDNDAFEANCELTIGESEKYIVFNHTIGVHQPYDTVDEFKYCLEIANQYIEEMKRLGVYDSSTIIITSDHGHIENEEYELEPSTPIFMIKHAGENHDKYLTNAAPICHSDIMATVLYNANLYYGDFNNKVSITSASVTDGLNEIEELIPGADKNTYSKNGENIDIDLSDEQLFGYPVEYYKENDIRTRQWFDRWYDSNYVNVGRFTVYCGFTYTGNTEDLEKKVEKKDMKEYQLPVKYE